jgi:RND family efflux transporter MFP subunit
LENRESNSRQFFKEQKPMQLNCLRVRKSVAILAASIFIVSGCAKPKVTVKQDPPEVTVSKPIVKEITDYYEFPGQTAAVGDVEIRARVTGYLKKVNFEDGQEVKKGDLLYEIDPDPYQADLDKAQGEIARLQAVMEKAKLDVARAERLRPSGAVSEGEYEDHVAQYNITKAFLRSAEAVVRQAELNLSFTKILSPIDGRVSRTRITEGNLVQVGSNDSNVMTTVVTTNPIYVTFNIEEPVLLKYAKSSWGVERPVTMGHIKELKIPVEVALENEEGYPHVGVLDFVDNKLNRTSGTICARGVLDNPNQSFSPGQYVRVRIPFGKPYKATMIGERAVGRDQKLKYLLVVNEKNVVEYRPVKVGYLRDGLRIIESGIGPDDDVIVNGLMRARPGITVKPHTETKNIAAESPASTPAAQSAKAGSVAAAKN